ncbi:MAG: hypothetical protein ABI386_06425 [Rhodanobacter sp.]
MNKLAYCFSAMAIACLFMGSVAYADPAAQAPAIAYPSMAALPQYLITDRSAEIALARSAAPEGISGKATIQVLEPSGYATVVKGSNGFVCIVERAWMSPFNSTQFWNPKVRGPDCYNPQAAQSILPIVYKRTALALRGLSKQKIRAAMKAARDARQLPALMPGAMSYMLSKQQHIGDQANQWLPHLMFYTPANADWGADANGSPVIQTSMFRGASQPIRMFLIPVGQWSDGSAAPRQ